VEAKRVELIEYKNRGYWKLGRAGGKRRKKG
jgi:hypothetical protein